MDHEHMQDGTLLFYNKKGGQGPAILILPDVGETIRNLFYVTLQHSLPGPSYLVELRGHGQSLGTYTLDGHWRDIQYWIMFLKKRHKDIYVIGKGVSASLLLRFEDEAHYLKERPPLPDGMVLLYPWFEPHKMPKQYRKELQKFSLRPVRMQTPTRIFIPDQDYTVDHLRKIFGNCLTFKVNPPASKIEAKMFLKKINNAITDVQAQEKPIRFRSYL